MKTFEKAAKTYDANSHVQQRIAIEMVNICKQLNPKSILDVGCGSGFLTNLLKEQFYNANVSALDSSFEMLNQIKLNNIQKHHAKYEDFLSEVQYDLIVSNAALHWMDFRLILKKIISQLSNSGTCVASIFTRESCYELKHALQAIRANDSLPVDFFPKFDECQSIIKGQFKDPEIKSTTMTLSFNNVKELLLNQKKTGVNKKVSRQGLWTPKKIQNLNQAFIDQFERIQLTYKIILFKGSKGS